jgi:hypothetical protein
MSKLSAVSVPVSCDVIVKENRGRPSLCRISFLAVICNLLKWFSFWKCYREEYVKKLAGHLQNGKAKFDPE